MGFTGLDFGIVIVYLVGITMFGIWIGKHQQNTRDYFLGNRNLPWLAISFSVIAAETSTLTFISIPGLAYISNMNFLQITFGYLLGRIIVSYVLLPAYYRGDIMTAYEFLGNRFGNQIRKFASVVFQVTRLLADGIRLFATAIPLSVITGWSYPVSIAIIGILTIIYTYVGGIKSVVWVDVIQMFVYLGGAVVAGVFILNHLPGGWNDVMSMAEPAQKFDIIKLGFEGGWRNFFKIDYTLISGILGGAFLSMASHGTDQLIVQRLLACRDVKQSQKALITSGVFIVFQFALFLILGILLYVYYQAQVVGTGSGFIEKPDQLFPKFIVEELPAGLSGIIIAGVFAAAMSTMSGSLNSLASSLMNDIYKPIFGKTNTPQKDLFMSRAFTGMWGIIFIGGAMLFKDQKNPVVELGLAIASFTYGGLLGAFLLGVIFKHVKEKAAMYAMWCTIFFMTWIIGIQGVKQYVIIGLNILAFLWLFFKSHEKKEQIILVIILIVNTTIIRAADPFGIAWPWYVILGCILSLGLGLLFQAFLSLGKSRLRFRLK